MVKMAKLWKNLRYFAAFSLCAAYCVQGYDYEIIKLENYCDQTVSLPCPSVAGSYNRAGKLMFYLVPWASCIVTVATSAGCDVPHAIYFNIPSSELALEDFVEISDSTGTVIKRIPGGASPRGIEPNSVAQMLTSYATNQRLTFKLYVSPSTQRSSAHEVHFDYTILKSQSGSNEAYCSALRGYMPNDLICTSPWEERVNCPAAYFATPDISNRAFRQQQPCVSTTGSTTSRRGSREDTTTYYYESPQAIHLGKLADGLKSMSIAWIFLILVAGTILGVFLLIVVMRLTGVPLPFIGPHKKPAEANDNADTNSLCNPHFDQLVKV